MTPPQPPAAPGPDPRTPAGSPPTETAEQRMRRHTRRAFFRGGFAAVAALAGWKWLQSRADAGGLVWPLRKVLQFNERLWSGIYSSGRLAPNFPRPRRVSRK